MIQIRKAVDVALAVHGAAQRGPAEWARPLTDDEWDWLEAHGYLQQVLQGHAVAEGLLDEIVKMRRAFVPLERAPRQRAATDPRSGRRHRHVHEGALAAVLVAYADAAPDDQWGIRSFRRRVLGDRLLTHPRAWLDAEVRRQRRPTIVGKRVSLVAIRVGDEILRRAIRRGGRLDRLRQVSDALARSFGWDPADAATYVLTGQTLPVSAIEARVQLALPLPARSKIVLTVDPTSTPAEVAAVYSAVRAEQFGRVRRLDEQHAKLAVFAARQGERPIDEQMAEWNAQVPRRRRYRFRSVFKREAEKALRSLTELRPQRAGK
jgi:hypothetical protein